MQRAESEAQIVQSLCLEARAASRANREPDAASRADFAEAIANQLQSDTKIVLPRRRLLNIALEPGRLDNAADMLGELAALEQRCRQQGRLFEDTEFALRASGRALGGAPAELAGPPI